MRKLIILDRKTLASSVDVSVFERFGELEVRDLTSKEELPGAIADVGVIIANKAILDAGVLSGAEKLRLICLLATGFNNVDVDYCKKRGIGVCNVPDYSTRSVAQHTLALALSLIESTAFYDNYVKSFAYSRSGVPTSHARPYFERAGKTWGIVGLGHIGRAVAKMAEAFGCRVIYTSTTGKNRDNAYRCVSFNELLERSDIVSLHCALNEQTRGLVSAEALSRMRRGALLINVARGPVVDEEALADALGRGRIRGACLDVFSREPLDGDSPLLSPDLGDRLVFSPHIAWASMEAQTRLLEAVCRNIESFDAGGDLNRIV